MSPPTPSPLATPTAASGSPPPLHRLSQKPSKLPLYASSSPPAAAAITAAPQPQTSLPTGRSPPTTPSEKSSPRLLRPIRETEVDHNGEAIQLPLGLQEEESVTPRRGPLFFSPPRTKNVTAPPASRSAGVVDDDDDSDSGAADAGAVVVDDVISRWVAKIRVIESGSAEAAAAAAAAGGEGNHRVQPVTASLFQLHMAHAITSHDACRLRLLLRMYGALAAMKQKSSTSHPGCAIGVSQHSPSLSSIITFFTQQRVVLVDDLRHCPSTTTIAAGPPISLLDHPFDPETHGTLMHLAVCSENSEVVDACLQSRSFGVGSAPYRMEDGRGDTPLTLAMRHAPSCVNALFHHVILTAKETAAARYAARVVRSGGKAGTTAVAVSPTTTTPVAAFSASEQVSSPFSAKRLFAALSSPKPLKQLEQEKKSRRERVDDEEEEEFTSLAACEAAAVRRAVHRTNFSIRNTLLHAAVSADAGCPSWPGRYAFIEMLLTVYGLRASIENALGCTPAMWARENRIDLAGGTQQGHEEVDAIIALLLGASEREQQTTVTNTPPRRALLRQLGVNLSPSQKRSSQSPAAGDGGSAARRLSSPSPDAAVVAASAASGLRHVRFCGSSSVEPPHEITTRSPSPLAVDPLSLGKKKAAAGLVSSPSPVRPLKTARESSAPAALPTMRDASPSVRMVLQYLHPQDPAESGGVGKSVGSAASPSLLRCPSLRPYERHAPHRSVDPSEPTVGAASPSMATSTSLRMSLLTSDAAKVRWRLQGPHARLLLFAVLLVLHCLKNALDMSWRVEGVWRSELWGTLWNLFFFAWGPTTFVMGIVRVLTVLVITIGVGYLLTPWLFGEVLLVRYLRIPLFGAESFEEFYYQQSHFGVFFSSLYSPVRYRSRGLLRPIGIVGSLYLSAKVYNLWVTVGWPEDYRLWAIIRSGLYSSQHYEPWDARVMWLVCWGFTLALDIFTLAFAIDMMYAQGVFNAFLPRFTYGKLAFWLDGCFYPWLRRHPRTAYLLLTPARLQVVQPVRRLAQLLHPTQMMRLHKSVSIHRFRLWCFWGMVICVGGLLAAPFWISAGVLSHRSPYTTSMNKRHYNEAAVSASPASIGQLISSWFCVFVASCSVLCAVLMSLQEWCWPAHSPHPLFTMPGGLPPFSYPQPSLVFFILLLVIESLDMCTVIENCRILVVFNPHPGAGGFGVCLAVLPLVVAVAVWWGMALSTSLHVVEQLTSQEGDGVQEEDEKAVTHRRSRQRSSLARTREQSQPQQHQSLWLLRHLPNSWVSWLQRRHLIAAWQSWAVGVHLFSSPVPHLFCLLWCLHPNHPAWADLSSSQSCNASSYSRSVVALVKLLEHRQLLDRLSQRAVTRSGQVMRQYLTAGNGSSAFLCCSSDDELDEVEVGGSSDGVSHTGSAITAVRRSRTLADEEEDGLSRGEEATLIHMLDRRQTCMELRTQENRSKLYVYAGVPAVGMPPPGSPAATASPAAGGGPSHSSFSHARRGDNLRRVIRKRRVSPAVCE